MRVLADTNILVRSAQPTHRDHSKITQAVTTLRAAGHLPCIVPQVICELWVVCTRPHEQNGFGMSVSRTREEIIRLKLLFLLMRDERAVFQHWENLVASHEVKGKPAHDARLVAAMHRHNVTHILTMNARDFARYPGIIVLTPDMVLAGGI